MEDTKPLPEGAPLNQPTAQQAAAGPEMMSAVQVIEEIFTYHAPVPEQVKRYEALRDKAKELALVIDGACPPSADRTDAIRKLRECIMVANASIALGGLSYR